MSGMQDCLIAERERQREGEEDRAKSQDEEVWRSCGSGVEDSLIDLQSVVWRRKDDSGAVIAESAQRWKSVII